jgi:hypothetical protein
MSHPSLRKGALSAGRSLPPLVGQGTFLDRRWIFFIPTTLASLACVFFARLPSGADARREVCLLAGLLLAAALVAGKQALKTLRHKRPVRTHVFRRGSFWRSLAVGLVLCYALVLLRGASAASGYWLAALSALWAGWLVMGLAVDPRVLQSWQWLAQRRSIKRGATAMQATVLLTVGLEAALQVRQHLGMSMGTPPASLRGVSLGGMFDDGDAFAAPLRTAAGPIRLGILGDELTLAAATDHALGDRLSAQLPMLQIDDYSCPQAGPREYARRRLVSKHGGRPDILLVFFSVGEDVASLPLESDWFDWRSLELAGYAQRALLAKADFATARPHSSAVAGSSPRELTVCRSPANRATETRWNKALRHLDRLHRQCQRDNIELVLVVVPADFQLNHVLAESLQRQAGYEPNTLDLTLPQRRVASFAADRQLACIDLLPHLQRCEGLVYERGHRRWTNEGATAVAQAIGGWLQSSLGSQVATGNARMVLR